MTECEKEIWRDNCTKRRITSPVSQAVTPIHYTFMNGTTPIGITNFRNDRKTFGIKNLDRMSHIYAIGKTGVGKSTLLLNMVISDIENGNGLCVIDPHGDLSEMLLQYIPEYRISDVIYLNPQDQEKPIAFNPLHAVHPQDQHLVVSGILSTLKKIWVDSWGPRLEYILRMTLLTLIEYPHATLLDIQALLTDEYFRNKVLMYCANEDVHSFWVKEYDKYPPALKAEAIAPILNKSGVLLASRPIQQILGQRVSSISIEKIMNGRQILIANLSKGTIGEDASAILGSILITQIQMAALKRASVTEEQRIPFYVYVDEMHTFMSLSFADILAEARKYKLSLFLTNQYVEQLHEKIRAAIFGNVGTFISFRVGAGDAAYVAKEFYPVFKEEDVISLPKFHMYLKLQIDGATSQPFSATTNPLPPVLHSYKAEVIATSRNTYGRSYIPKTHTSNTEEHTPPTLF